MTHNRSGRRPDLAPCIAASVAALLCLTAATAHAQAPPRPQATTTITLEQIVARQEENYRRIRSGEGTVVWREQLGTTASAVAPLRVILFAFEADRSVNLILPCKDPTRLPQLGEKIDWTSVLAACFVDRDAVYNITVPRGGGSPQVEPVPFNPAVHERNPLIAFHPRLLGDERVTLADLTALANKMATRPAITPIVRGDKKLLRIDFGNTSAPGELLYYVVNPAKGYMTEEIGRFARGRMVMETRIIIGQTKDNTWIPARREKSEYDAAGRPVRWEGWYYESLAINERLAPKTLSLGFFHLPASARIRFTPAPVQTEANPPPSGGSPTPTPGASPTPPSVGSRVRPSPTIPSIGPRIRPAPR
jgi:hypothetical protein